MGGKSSYTAFLLWCIAPSDNKVNLLLFLKKKKKIDNSFNDIDCSFKNVHSRHECMNLLEVVNNIFWFVNIACRKYHFL